MNREYSDIGAGSQLQFLSGGGEMGKLTREKDWSQTSVGPVDSWPQSLRTTLSIILHSRFPMFLWWGEDLICFYNDAYRPSLGHTGKHPDILGMPAKDAWHEIWDVIQPMIDQVLSGGPSVWNEDQLIPIYRNGQLEDVYWTFSYSPVNDETGRVKGVLVTCNETTVQMKTLADLKAREAQLNFTLDAADLGTWDFNPATNKFVGNDRLKSWFGIDIKDEIDLSIALKVIHPDERLKVIDAIAKATAQGSDGNYDIAYTILNPESNKSIRVVAKGRAEFDAEGNVTRFSGTMEDITEQTQAIQKILESEHRFRTLIEEASVATAFYTGPEMRLQYANELMLGFWGKDSSIIGKPLIEGIPELKGQPFQKLFEEVYTTGKDYVGQDEKAELEVDGELRTFYFTYTYKALRDIEGTIYGIHHMATDVTEQVKSRMALSESDKQFRNTVKQAPVGITILRGEDFIVEMANAKYLELVDREERSFVGRPIFESLPEVKDTVEQLLAGVLHSGTAFQSEEFSVTLNRFGKEALAYFNLLYHPLREEDGTVSGVMVVATEVTESVKAKQRLAESEAQFRNMVMQSPIPMTIVRGKEHIIEMANTVMYEQIWRKKEEEVMGRSILSVFPELREQKYEELLNHVFTTGTVHREIESVAYVQGNDGLRKFYLDFEYAPLHETDDVISGIIITVSDVTEKVEARLAVETSEQRITTLLKTAPFPIGVYIGKDMIIEIANQTIIDIFGKGSDVIGKSYKELLPELGPQGIFDQLDQVYETGIPFHSYNTHVFVEENGIMKPYYFNYSLTPLVDPDGKVYGVMNTAANVTDLNIAKQKVEESEERFRKVADSAPVLIWMSGLDMAFYYFNTAWLNFTGRSMEEEYGNGWMDSVYEDDLPKCIDVYTKAFNRYEPFHVEFRLKRHDGTYRWISDNGVPRFTADGVFEGYIGAGMDIHEQVIYQKALKEDEERLNIVISASDLGTWDLDVSSNKVNYSERFIEIFGFERTDKVAHADLVARIHKDDMAVRSKAFAHAYTTGQLQYSARICWPDNSIHWMETKGKVFYDQDNKPEKLIGTLRDITEEKNYQQQLQAREEKFRLLADVMPQFVWTGGADGILDYFNQSVYRATGLEPADMINNGWIQIVHPEDREANIRKWLHSVNTGEEFICEHRFKMQNGEYRWQLSRAIPQKDNYGNIQMWVGTSTDIQEQKMFTQELEKQVQERINELALLNEELVNSEERYHLMVSEVQEYSIIFINHEGLVQNWNKGAEKIKGYVAEEIIGQHFSVFYTDYDKKNQLPNTLLKQAELSGKAMQEGMRVRKDGSVFWANVVITAIYSKDGHVVGFSKVTHDLTEKKLADDKLRMNAEQLFQKNRELEKMNKELKSFAYISSHDLQEPLRKIQIFAARIVEKEWESLSERGKDYFTRMQQSANRMQTLIQDLLTYSLTNVTDRVFVMKDINDIVDEVRQELAEKIAENHVRLEVQDLCEVNMIPFQFVQLMHNLIGNAIKFARKDITPVINISCRTETGIETGMENLIPSKKYCHIIVADNGIGFDDKYKARIFEVFQRLHERQEYTGTGIGLAIVKKIVENHNGAITATGALNQGAKFDIYIPFH